MRILGVDPGSRIMGYGIIDAEKQTVSHVTSGCIRLKSEPLPQRLKIIFQQLEFVIQAYQPQQLSIEQVFVSKNVDAALKLGHARGTAICVAVLSDLEIFEYTPRQIKQAVVGKGSADKLQVQHMVKILLNLTGKLQVDTSDALAIALTHHYLNHTANMIGMGSANSNYPHTLKVRGGRLR